MADNTLGEYLRARRELVTPGDVGLPAAGVRRVPGLRREEVALLAGISADYYLRLEQGRDRNPSVQVVESLARVLQLDEPATRYLLKLAAPAPRRRRRTRREVVPAGTLRLLDRVGVPAYVEGRYFDVLAANDVAGALSPNLRPGHNRLRDLFLDPAEQALHTGWPGVAPMMVARFREAVGTDTDDERVERLVGELSLASGRFRTLWARHDVNLGTPHTTRMMHPQVGQLDLDMEKLAVMGTDRQMLVLLHADAASPTGERLALLASLAASTAPSSAPAEAPAESSSAPAEGAGSASPTTRPTDTT
ncbi:helix-turn-helix transcriptional regulator [Promicromonospora thailandica]|uniref:Helix-turn-helix domain-containing protein n=1 Tax=Promicromonospora thailandica TaxID=765201 RepID=A0A9X2JUZ7_9MICO|nr:helix-turn-helix transcriptional regulator [Promicromonospora thailandica]MCP2264017.1 Helix-turn-helix domain-containing protein [Promicromonospora thailandica]